MKSASVKTTPEIWVFRQAYPVVFFQTVAFIRPNQNIDGDRLDIFSAHVLELGRNIEQGIVTVDNNMNIHNDVPQSLHRWPQYVGKGGLPDILWLQN